MVIVGPSSPQHVENGSQYVQNNSHYVEITHNEQK